MSDTLQLVVSVTRAIFDMLQLVVSSYSCDVRHASACRVELPVRCSICFSLSFFSYRALVETDTYDLRRSKFLVSHEQWKTTN